MIDSVRNAPLLLDRSRWAGRRNFTVLQTQFDAGRRFIDTWRAWRDDPQRCERLHFVAVVAPDSMTTPSVSADQPALSKLLADAWPMPVAGVHRLEFDDGRFLPESGAIIAYLADGSKLIPQSRWDRAQMLQWMFFEQYSHEPYVAVARFWLGFAPKEQLETKKHLVPEWHAKGNAALGVMETHLKTHDWFAGNAYSIADIALYGYTHCAGDGGFTLNDYPAVSRWLKRVAEQPGHVTMAERW